eukprot:8366725-Pyramimonas_sp.AAC.1
MLHQPPPRPLAEGQAMAGARGAHMQSVDDYGLRQPLHGHGNVADVGLGAFGQVLRARRPAGGVHPSIRSA